MPQKQILEQSGSLPFRILSEFNAGRQFLGTWLVGLFGLLSKDKYLVAASSQQTTVIAIVASLSMCSSIAARTLILS